MSKQSEAKKSQGYVAKAVPQTCQHCANMRSRLDLPRWMRECNELNPQGAVYGIEIYGAMTDLRCALGGFAVKKMGACNEWKAMP